MKKVNKQLSKQMNYGIKISHEGFDVTNLEKARSKKSPQNKTLPNLLSTIALPYLLGAKKQVERYQKAASLLALRPTISVMECLHEASTLFEDLNTITVYMRKCGKDHKQHLLWEDIRNHIRHAVREEFNKENESTKNARAERLGLDPKLQMSIGFDINAIKIGTTIIEIIDIKKYLAWAEGVIAEILSKAEKDGYFTQEKK